MDGTIKRRRHIRGGARKVIILLTVALVINLVVVFPLAMFTNWLVAVCMGETVDMLSVAYAACLIPTLSCTYSMCLKIPPNNTQNDKTTSHEKQTQQTK